LRFWSADKADLLKTFLVLTIWLILKLILKIPHFGGFFVEYF